MPIYVLADFKLGNLTLNEAELLELVQMSLMLVIKISLPPMLAGLVVGVTIALFQALTQIQEITLVFVPKIVAVFLVIFMFFPNMTEAMTVFFETIADRMVAIN